MIAVFVLSIIFQAMVQVAGDWEACSGVSEWSKGITQYRNMRYREQLFVYASCSHKEYRVDGHERILCRNGQLTSTLPECKKVVIVTGCVQLTAPQHGSKKCSENAPEVGSECTFQCASTHFLSGASRRYCTQNLKWTGTTTTCIPRTVTSCGPLPRLLHGSTTCSDTAPKVGSVCKFQCDSTHFLKGSAERRCARNLQWTGTQTRCLLRPECPISPLDHGTIEGCSVARKPRFGDVCTFRCNEGFLLVGSNRMECRLHGVLADGQGGKHYPRCHRVDGPCVTINCQHFCSAVSGEARCSCAQGFQLKEDGENCADIDECQSNTHHCQHKCHNKRGSYYCTCEKGYAKTDAYHCEADDPYRERWRHDGRGSSSNNRPRAPNPCDLNNGGCDQECEGQSGVVRCKCRAGFELQDNGMNCRPVATPPRRFPHGNVKTGSVHPQTPESNSRPFTACSLYDGYCSQECDDRDGTVRCSCRRGYKLRFDSRTCEDVNECAHGNFGCSHGCFNEPGAAHCTCPVGFALRREDEKTCEDVDECSGKQLNKCDHLCFNTIGSYHCSCNPGYVSPDDFHCEKCRMHSYRGSQDAACIDCPPRSHTDAEGKTSLSDCKCDPGFSGDPTGHIPCEDIDECSTGNFGCSNSCFNTPGSAHCSCPPGFQLEEDRKTCRDIDECSIMNGGCDGVCHNSVGNFTCSCPEGYADSRLNRYSCDDVDECSDDNGGCSDTCVNFQGGYHCSCQEGYHLHLDGKSCVAVYCPKVYVPHHSTLRCRNTPAGNKTTYRPGEVPEDIAFPVGAFCRIKCERGYGIRSSSAEIVCQSNGEWNATQPECEVLQCPPLLPPENGDVYPPSCKEGHVAVKEKCVFTCLPGYRITGPEIFTCQNKLSWSVKNATVCVPDTEPFIACPEDINVDLMTNESSVEIKVDSPQTNLEGIEITPSWVTLETPILFPAGTTEITFRATSPNGQTAKCSLSVFVIDKQPPVFYDCPETLHATGTGLRYAVVDWKEPVATDNVGILSVSKTIEPNTTLPPGVHGAEYIARDFAGNVGRCSFKINVTLEGGCRDLEDPENGEANCMEWMFGKICQPSCHLNYTRGSEEPEFFACNDSGTWTPSTFISPCLPECLKMKCGTQNSRNV